MALILPVLRVLCLAALVAAVVSCEERAAPTAPPASAGADGTSPAAATATPTASPAPAAAKPLVLLFQRQKDPEQTRQNAEEAARYLSQALGRPVQTVVPGDYGASVQALVSEQADAAYLSALPFLLARRDGGARLLLAEVRPDLTGARRTTSDSVWVARADGPVASMDDVVARARDLRVCFTSRTSTSGYVMATLSLVRAGLLRPGQDPREAFQSVAFGGGYTQALQEVLAGRADLAAVSHYTVEGPTADVYTTPAERERLRVIARTPDVPTHLVAVRRGLSPEVAEQLAPALLRLSSERPDLLANVYGASELRRVDEAEHVRPTVEAVEAVGLPIENLTSQSPAR